MAPAFARVRMEKEGVLPPIHRDKNGRRIYSDKGLGLIQVICCMRVTGMSMEYIKKCVELCILGEKGAKNEKAPF